MSVEGDCLDFSAPALLVVPTHAIDRFEYAKGSTGWALTVAKRHLGPLAERAPELSGIWAAPLRCRYPTTVGLLRRKLRCKVSTGRSMTEGRAASLRLRPY